MARPTLRAQVAFDTDPLEAPAWTTIHEGTSTARVLDAQVKTGRSFELDAFQPGQMTVGLDNSDRRFDPLHAAGPYYGDLLPRKRCRLQADWGSYLNLTGASTSGAYVLDTAVLDIVGDIDIRARVAPADWTPAAASIVIGKADLTGNFSWAFGVQTSGKLQLAWSPTGALGGLLSTDSTVAVGAADGATRWVRVTMDVNDGGGNRVVKFYTSTDDTHDHTAVTWTQLGSTVTTAGTTSIFSGSASLIIGLLTGGVSTLTGKVYAAAVLSGIGGTVVADPDFTDGNRFTAGASTGVDAAGRTWTVASPASLNAVTYDLFSGFVDTWPQDFGRFQATAQLTATDGLKILSRIDIAGAHEEVVRADSPIGWWRLGDDPATSTLCADASGNGSDGRYLGGPTRVESIVDGTTDGAIDFDGVNDRVVIATDAGLTNDVYSIEAWFTTSATPGGSGSIIWGQGSLGSGGYSLGWYLSVAPTGVLTGSGPVGTSVINDGAIHHAVLTSDGVNSRLYVDGVLEDTDVTATITGRDWIRIGSPPVILPGSRTRFEGVIDEVAIYDYALTADQVAAHYNAGADIWAGDTTGERIDRALTLAGWPAADRDIDTGRSTMGAYTAGESNILAVAQEAETTEGGALWQAPDGKVTFRDRHAPIQDYNATVSQAVFTDDSTATNPNHYTALDLAYDDTLIVNEAEVAWVDGTETSRDEASIDAYTRQATRIDTALPTAPEARDRGDWLLARYAQPAVRPTRLVLRPAGDQRLWRHCLARRIGDRVTVRRKPQNTGDPIEFDATIESIGHRIGDGINIWETEFGLSPTAIDLGWLILDDTAEGLLDTGRLAF